jgi:erythritol kinase
MRMGAVCVDAGTTVIKAVGYDDEGTEVVVVRRSAAVAHPRPAWAEQDMTAVWLTVAECVREATEQLKSAVDFVAVTAQGDGCWLVDSAGEPTGPAILWNDGRAAEVVEEWTRSGVLGIAFRRNGSLTFAGLPNAILHWLNDHDPDRLARSHAALTCGGWIFARLTGEFVTDLSDGSAPFLDLETRTFSADLFQLYGLDWARRLLPEPREGYRVAPILPEIAAKLGLPPGTPVVLSPYDIASTATGVGAVDDGQACCILGTTLCTEVVTTRVDLGRQPAGLTIALSHPDRYLRAFPTLAGGEVITWACALLGLANAADLGELARQSDPGAHGLAFLPYLSPAGERAPFLDPTARGALLGLSLNHGREHVARAVMEGLSLVVRDCLDAARVRPIELRLCGGGAASEPWSQLIADVIGIPVRRSVDAEVGARGAYLVGLVATEVMSDIGEAARRHVRVRDTFQPDADRRARYDQLYDDFLSLRAVETTQWPRLAAMRGRDEETTQ